MCLNECVKMHLRERKVPLSLFYPLRLCDWFPMARRHLAHQSLHYLSGDGMKEQVLLS